MAAGQAAEWSANGKVGRELRAREAVATGYCHHQCPGWRQPKGLCGAQERWGLGGPESWLMFCCCSCSLTKSCLTLCNPMDCSTLGFPVLHHLPEFVQTHVHWVGDAIQPSHPLSLPSPALSLSQHQGFFQWSVPWAGIKPSNSVLGTWRLKPLEHWGGPSRVYIIKTLKTVPRSWSNVMRNLVTETRPCMFVDLSALSFPSWKPP